MKPERSRTFAKNLDHLLRLQGFGRKSASEAIGVPYKWLRRAVSKGISAPSAKNAHHLEKLVSYFNLPNHTEFWRHDLIRVQVCNDIPIANPSFERVRRQRCLKQAMGLLSTEHALKLYTFVERLFSESGITLSEPPPKRSSIPSTWKSLVKWAGSKKRQAAKIVRLFPKRIATYYEPFLGGGYVLLELLTSEIEVGRFECSDSYGPLIRLWNLIKHEPEHVSRTYADLWSKLESNGERAYYSVRTRFNEFQDPCDLFFLVHTTRNGFFWYSKAGEFKGRFRVGDFGTKGASPQQIEHRLAYWSEMFVTRNVAFKECDYRDATVDLGDLLYLDPPYPKAGSIYPAQINFTEFWSWLADQRCPYYLSLPGFRAGRDLTASVPIALFDEHLQISFENPFLSLAGSDQLASSDSLYIRRHE
jgi:DNA adenine methylase